MERRWFAFDWPHVDPFYVQMGFGALLLVTVAFAATRRAPNVPAPEPVVAKHPDTDLLPLTLAESLSAYRGGDYVYGYNDCSTFVSDYIRLSGHPLEARITTKELNSAVHMIPLGFDEVETLPNTWEEGDILVFRYYDLDTRGETGHCGVLLYDGGELCVAHVSSPLRGFAVTPLREFMDKRYELPLTSPMRCWRARAE